MKEFAPFVPDPALEPVKLEVVAQALEDGLYDKHLQFMPVEQSPTSDLSSREYGYVLKPRSTEAAGVRPRREPMDWRTVATDTLHIPRSTRFTDIAERIHASHVGWETFLQQRQGWSPDMAASFSKIRRLAFKVGDWTENNLPAYKQDISSVLVRAKGVGSHVLDMLNDELRLWTAEEDAHSVSGAMYGEITDMIGDAASVAARNSQLRAGSSEAPIDITHTKVYTAVQEKQTYIAHMKDAAMQEPVGHALLAREAADETRHHNLFRREVTALMQAFPDDTVRMIAKLFVHDTFAMPGSRGIPNFIHAAMELSRANMLTKADFYETVSQCLGFWGLLDTASKPAAVDALLTTDAAKYDLDRLRQEYGGEHTVRDTKRHKGFVLGETITIEELNAARSEYLPTIAA